MCGCRCSKFSKAWCERDAGRTIRFAPAPHRGGSGGSFRLRCCVSRPVANRHAGSPARRRDACEGGDAAWPARPPSNHRPDDRRHRNEPVSERSDCASLRSGLRALLERALFRHRLRDWCPDRLWRFTPYWLRCAQCMARHASAHRHAASLHQLPESLDGGRVRDR